MRGRKGLDLGIGHIGVVRVHDLVILSQEKLNRFKIFRVKNSVSIWSMDEKYL